MQFLTNVALPVLSTADTVSPPSTVVPLTAGAVDPGLVRVRVRIAQGTGNAAVDAQGTALDPKDAVFRLAHNNILRAVR